jgi:hypothetical protein
VSGLKYNYKNNIHNQLMSSLVRSTGADGGGNPVNQNPNQIGYNQGNNNNQALVGVN